VTIRVLQDQSSFGDERTVYNYPENEDGDSRGSVQVQDINRQSVVTTVVAKDANVVVIGGLITEKMVDKETGIPLLKDIPGLGWLFKDKIQSKEKKELIILIRPHVILAPGETQGRSRELLDRVSSNSAVKSIMEGKRDALALESVIAEPAVDDEKSEPEVEVIVDDK
jgi:type II secretory pathway component GspD/PulD (secretin)